MKKIILSLTLLFITFLSFGQGYQVGSKAQDFSLLSTDGKMVSMADFKEAKGFILIFTCNSCPYSIAYEDRKIGLHNQFAPLGYPVIALNPNDSIVQPKDSFTKMVERASQKSFPFNYLLDSDQKNAKIYGATRTPHVFVLNKENNDFIVRYIGAIDDNFEDASAVTKHYVQDAVNSLLEGKTPEISSTKAIGCGIKFKK